MYGVWCQVSGGYTGTRVAWLKDGGREYRTDDYSAALHKAELLNETMNGPNARAYFSYSVKRVH